MQWLDLNFWIGTVIPIVGFVAITVTLAIVYLARTIVSTVTVWKGSVEEEYKCKEFEHGVVARDKNQTIVGIKRANLQPKYKRRGLRTFKKYFLTETNAVLYEPSDWKLEKELEDNRKYAEVMKERAKAYLDKHEDVIKGINMDKVDWDNPVLLGVLVDAERMQADRRGMINVMPSEVGRIEDIGIDKALNDWGTGSFSLTNFLFGIMTGIVIIYIFGILGWIP